MIHNSRVIDAVIPAHEKDLDTLNYCIEGIRKNIPGIRRIIVVSKEKYTNKAEWYNEALFPFSFQEVRGYVGGISVGWYLQQLIKLYAVFVIPDISENVLIVDSDTVFMHKVEMISAEGLPLYNPSKDKDVLQNPFYLKVLNHAQKMLPELKLENIPAEFRNVSGISHHMLFQKSVMEDLFKRVEANDKDGDPFYRIFLKYSDSGHFASEYIIYYLFILIYYFDRVKFRKLNYKNTADFNVWKYRLRRKYDYCSFHSYMRVGKKKNIWQKIHQKTKEIICKLFFYEYWNIGVVEARIEEFLHRDDFTIKWFTQKPCGYLEYLADPFGFEFDEKKYVIYESFNFWDKKGDIKVARLDENLNLVDIKTVISDKIHSSYPYVFSEASNLYTLIERNKERSLAIYRFETPYKLTKVKTILENKRVIDPSIIKHNGIWWLFFVDYDDGDNKLQIAYSDNLFGSWQMHPYNLTKTCPKTSRSAGSIFHHAGGLYRPTQNCSKTYGASIIINKITKLTKTEFSDEVVKEIFPPRNSKYNKGIHTISSFGELTFIDGKTQKFVPFKSIFSLVRSLYRAIKKYVL